MWPQGYRAVEAGASALPVVTLRTDRSGRHAHAQLRGCEISCLREWSMNDPWCCGRVGEEGIHVREVLLADYILPKLVLMRLAHFIY